MHLSDLTLGTIYLQKRSWKKDENDKCITRTLLLDNVSFAYLNIQSHTTCKTKIIVSL